jgi:hypothetical protein
MEKPPALSPALVNEFVAKSHGDLGRVKELLAEHPTLINAAWDWGGGDWETGLGAAAHVGRREIALYLIDNGARMDIFAAAMLGELEIAQKYLTAFPDMVSGRGPHGIPLLNHAEAGGEYAEPVVALLRSLGAL